MDKKYITYILLFLLGFSLNLFLSTNNEYFRYDYDKAFDDSEYEWSRDPLQFCPQFCQKNIIREGKGLRLGGCGQICRECHTNILTKGGEWCMPNDGPNTVCARNILNSNKKRCLEINECNRLDNIYDCSGPQFRSISECLQTDCEDNIENNKIKVNGINIRGKGVPEKRGQKTRRNKNKMIVKNDNKIWECKLVSSGHKKL